MDTPPARPASLSRLAVSCAVLLGGTVLLAGVGYALRPHSQAPEEMTLPQFLAAAEDKSYHWCSGQHGHSAFDFQCRGRPSRWFGQLLERPFTEVEGFCEQLILASDPEAAEFGAEFAGEHQLAQFRPALLKSLRRDFVGPGLARSLAYAIGKVGRREDFDLLLGLAREPDPVVWKALYCLDSARTREEFRRLGGPGAFWAIAGREFATEPLPPRSWLEED